MNHPALSKDTGVGERWLLQAAPAASTPARDERRGGERREREAARAAIPDRPRLRWFRR